MDQPPRPDESRDDHQDHQRDLDAEFAALMGDVDIPDDLSAEDLGAVQEAGSDRRLGPVGLLSIESPMNHCAEKARHPMLRKHL